MKTVNQTQQFHGPRLRRGLSPRERLKCLLSRYLGDRYLGALVDELNHILRLAFVRSYEQAF